MTEEEHYASVLEEISNGQRREGLWAKAVALCDGDEERAKHLYVKLRVEQRIAEQQGVLRGDWNRRILFFGSLALIVIVSILRAWGHSAEFEVDFVFARLASFGAYCIGLMFLAAMIAGTQTRPFFKLYVKLIVCASFIHVIVILCSDVQLAPVHRPPTADGGGQTQTSSADLLPVSPSPVAPNYSTGYSGEGSTVPTQSSFPSSVPSKAERLSTLQQTFALLKVEYDALAVRRKGLTPDDHEQLAAFNRDAADYTRRVQEANAQQARLQ